MIVPCVMHAQVSTPDAKLVLAFVVEVLPTATAPDAPPAGELDAFASLVRPVADRPSEVRPVVAHHVAPSRRAQHSPAPLAHVVACDVRPIVKAVGGDVRVCAWHAMSSFVATPGFVFRVVSWLLNRSPPPATRQALTRGTARPGSTSRPAGCSRSSVHSTNC